MDSILKRKQVKEILGIKENRTLTRYIAQRAFPAPFRYMTPHVPVWRKKDVEKWMSAKTG
jgi:predicted DNA-binding transcriptional regulator AlpA